MNNNQRQQDQGHDSNINVGLGHDSIKKKNRDTNRAGYEQEETREWSQSTRTTPTGKRKHRTQETTVTTRKRTWTRAGYEQEETRGRFI